MKKRLLPVVPAVLLLCPVAGGIQAETFHVSLAGDDSQTGSSPAEAWKTVERVNRQAFQPGDSILFQSGGTWQGQLRPQGSGVEGKPMRLDRYGDGPLPVIDMGTNSGAVLALKNQDWWEIAHLELRGQGGPRVDRQGISIEGHDAGRVLRHLWIRNCRIHDIWGTMDYLSSGIWIAVPRWVSPWGNRVSFDDVLIEGNDIRRADRCGVVVWTPAGEYFAPAVLDQKLPFKWEKLLPSTRVLVRGNTFEDIGGDAVLVLGSNAPLIERNTARRTCLRSGGAEITEQHNPSSAAIWLHSCTRGVMQFNAVYESGKQPRNNDGMSYDLDFNCRDCVLQYNYSQDNQGGFLLIMPSARNNLVRYNLSQNDRSHVLFLVGSVSESNLVYNNVFYTDAAPADVHCGATYQNNIFFASGQGRFILKSSPNERTAFRRNCFFGPWDRLPDDPEAIRQDPSMKLPGGGKGLDSLAGYQLQPASPCINAAVVVPNHGGRDFWGNPLTDGKPDIGMHESTGAPHQTKMDKQP